MPNTKIYRDQGGAVETIGVGGSLNVYGTVTMKAGSTFDASLLGVGLGFIPLDLNTCRILTSNAIINTTEAGLPDGNTDPLLARVNGATDIAARLVWAATSVVEVQFSPVALPPDIDDGLTLTVNLLIAKDTNTDTTAVVAVKIFQGIGDTNAGGNTAALAVATLAKYSVTMAAADLAAYPSMLNIALVPGTHGTDAIRLHAAWIEYTKKTT